MKGPEHEILRLRAQNDRLLPRSHLTIPPRRITQNGTRKRCGNLTPSPERCTEWRNTPARTSTDGGRKHAGVTSEKRKTVACVLHTMDDQAPSSGMQRIGELAAELGLNPKTLRYYEGIGLLPQPARNAAGYRLYGAAERDRLLFIAKGKALGFTLQEIGQILALRDAGTEPCAYVQSLVDQKLASVTAQLRFLEDLRGDLQVLHTEAQNTTCSCTPICSIIELHVSSRPAAPQAAADE